MSNPNTDTKNALAGRKAEIAEQNGEQREVEKQKPTLWSLLESPKIVKAFTEAIPEGLYSVGMLRQDIIRAAKADQKLLDCDPVEVLGAAMSFAQLGLRPNSPLQEGWLVPIPNYRKQVMNCQVLFGYQGLERLAYNTGLVSNLYAENVYENDTFRVSYGLRRDLVHEPTPPGKPRGEVIAYYTVADMHGGAPRFESWTVDEVIEHRDKYVAKTDVWEHGRKTGKKAIQGVWIDNPHAMARKTVLRSMLKHMPKATTPEYLRLMQGMYVDGRIRTNLDPEAIDMEGTFPDAPDEFPDVPGVRHGATIDAEVAASPDQVGKIAELFERCEVNAPGKVVEYSIVIAGADPDTVRNLPDLTDVQAADVIRKLGHCLEDPDSVRALDQVLAEAQANRDAGEGV